MKPNDNNFLEKHFKTWSWVLTWAHFTLVTRRQTATRLGSLHEKRRDGFVGRGAVMTAQQADDLRRTQVRVDIYDGQCLSR